MHVFAPFSQREYTEVEATHVVSDPPTFSGKPSDSMYIIELSEDRFHQTHPDDVLLLTTIIFDGEQEATRKERLRVHWMQRKMNRDNVLDFFRATWLCRQPDALCNLFHNGRQWPMADQSIRHLDYGDHLRLQVRSSGPSWSELEHSEGIDRHRRVYASSSDDT